MGWHPSHLKKPLVAVVNSFNELMPGHVHLQPLCQAIKLGIAEAGGTPLEFPSIAICDGLATGHAGMRMPMVSRELIADSIELMITAHAFDAAGRLRADIDDVRFDHQRAVLDPVTSRRPDLGGSASQIGQSFLQRRACIR